MSNDEDIPRDQITLPDATIGQLIDELFSRVESCAVAWCMDNKTDSSMTETFTRYHGGVPAAVGLCNIQRKILLDKFNVSPEEDD